jgi:FkbM family methyltransferase
LAWRFTPRRGPLVVALRTGERIILRPPPSTDLSTAYELFTADCYRPPRPLGPESVRRIIDLGANVGYSVLYWQRAFPSAETVAFEPHPTHCEQIRRHLRLNRAEDRVRLVEAAAGTADGRAVLSDRENCSSVVGTTDGLAVPVVDVFAAAAGGPVDLLKIDIEGAEYPILADPRFAELRPRAVVLEWHAVAGPVSGPEWCQQRLAGLGYDTYRTWEARDHGIIWAFA